MVTEYYLRFPFHCFPLLILGFIAGSVTMNFPGTCDPWMVPNPGARRDAASGAERFCRYFGKSISRPVSLRAYLQCRPHLNHRPFSGNLY